MLSLSSLALASSLLIPSAFAQRGAYHGHESSGPPLLQNVTIFDPPENYTVPRTLYARTLLLNQNCQTDNVILATWENYLPTENNTQTCPENCPENPYMPIYQSLDGGQTWSERAKVYDQVNGWGLRYQPDLYELAEPVGNYSAGTLLLAANSIPADLSETKIDIYASTDVGYTWHFVSSVARGGYASPTNDVTPIWEPFFFMYDHTLILYYSDQRDDRYGQAMVHQTTTDLHRWSDLVFDIRFDDEEARPGMPIVSELPYGNYIMTYEYHGYEEENLAVHYRISDSPLTFDSKPGHLLQATDGTIPIGSPTNVWTPAGGPFGTIVVTDGSNSEVFLNHNLGAPGAWTKVPTGMEGSYTKFVMVMPDPEQIMVAGGGWIGGQDNKVMVSTIDITPIGPPLARCNKRD